MISIACLVSRQPRFVLPGHPQHVIQRGDSRDVIFVLDDVVLDRRSGMMTGQ